jgi:GDP/UDP-N,N'-diacetylbacillosamine 2-epimerase (hydrolysing)
MSESIISCDPTSVQISESIMKLYSKDFQNKVKNAVNPYGMPGACKKIVDVVSGVSLDSLIVKTFHDLAGSQK